MPTLGTFGAASARGFGLTTAGRLVANIAISSNTSNYTLNTAKVTGYKAGATDVVLTINSGIFVSSSSTGSYAFTVDTSWTTGDTLTIINNGTIIGRGGNGGNGGGGSGGPGNGGSGGPALLVQRSVSINNGNRISGGGGGGGGGDANSSCATSAAGGGGGGGIGGSNGGASAVAANVASSPGQAGTLTSQGNGGAGATNSAGCGKSVVTQTGFTGGNGGSFASSGGGSPRGAWYASSGGAGGAAVVGNSNITWIATGTRNGSIS
jgi:hypothetical protein